MITKSEIYKLLVALKKDITDEYRCSDDPDDNTPGMTVTFGTNDAQDSWSYQTGDNSFTGGAYGFPHWAVICLFRRSNCKELTDEVFEQWGELTAV